MHHTKHPPKQALHCISPIKNPKGGGPKTKKGRPQTAPLGANGRDQPVIGPRGSAGLRSHWRATWRQSAWRWRWSGDYMPLAWLVGRSIDFISLILWCCQLLGFSLIFWCGCCLDFFLSFLCVGVFDLVCLGLVWSVLFRFALVVSGIDCCLLPKVIWVHQDTAAFVIIYPLTSGSQDLETKILEWKRPPHFVSCWGPCLRKAIP